MDRRTFISTALISAPFLKVYTANGSPVDSSNLLLNDIDFSGGKDSTDALQKVLDQAAGYAQIVPNGVQKVLIQLSGVIRISKTLYIDASKINILGPVTLVFSQKSRGRDYAIVLRPDGQGNVSYTNGVGSLFDSINFVSENKINLIYASNNATPGSNPSCLINISQCRFTGFNRIFSNGVGGWGWNWDRCGFDNCNFLLYLIKEKDSYERFSFSSCIWQNGGTAFYIDNPLGQIYWQGGSFDYFKEIAHIINGHVTINGHVEFAERDSPIVTIHNDISSFFFNGGCIFIGKNKSQYYLFEQYNHNQVTLNNVTLLTDGVNNDFTVLSNKRVSVSNMNFTSDFARNILAN
ncbi:hypothetical protein ACXH4D_002906 [Klebsiella variicola]|jgi:hypothetical protein|uniref:hypothetical protein n=1 Tax=Klebsiella TaxID=570 RepID=UPI000ADBAB0D|nr:MULTISPECIES: hypothetical protein [Klebsiella]HCI6743158.1 hypothetical protein [Klebsiella variicola subsp. variicola]MBQ5273767.1 hypothetical protein [Klebsiella quasipneumoniae]MCC5461303.1 hypothetical protein [Klebsiella quasipneumoniae subsp. similipneumoniae]MDE8369000.1 hypothetical protein [Klebsiella variicola]QLS59315.1 hypothetical protein HV312_08230 [Klebsiella variicola]